MAFQIGTPASIGDAPRLIRPIAETGAVLGDIDPGRPILEVETVQQIVESFGEYLPVGHLRLRQVGEERLRIVVDSIGITHDDAGVVVDAQKVSRHGYGLEIAGLNEIKTVREVWAVIVDDIGRIMAAIERVGEPAVKGPVLNAGLPDIGRAA